MTYSQGLRRLSPATAAAPDCLSDEDVLAFAAGRLAPVRYAEFHAHLDLCEVCQQVVSEAAHALAHTPQSTDVSADALDFNTSFKPGALLARRYLIQNFVARGGMGEVYEAFDCELQERVALKTVTSTTCDNPRAVRRLKAEVQLARRVSHPNVCRIYEFGMHSLPANDSQIYFLTMEFVDGETLGQRIRLCGALPLADVLTIARQLLQGLSAAHKAGILHRDFKSDNVLLRGEQDGSCTPVILDFGLARALDESSRGPGSTGNRTLVGTVEYIAPEQVEGKPLTTASDVYSFGVAWFEMLTGELPFESTQSPAACALERLRKDPAAPSKMNRAVPSELDAIVLRCLSRDPTARFQSAAEVLAALDALGTLGPGARRRGRTSQHLAALGLATTVVFGFAAHQLLRPEPMTAHIASARTAALGAPRASIPPAAREVLSRPPSPVTITTAAPTVRVERRSRRQKTATEAAEQPATLALAQPPPRDVSDSAQEPVPPPAVATPAGTPAPIPRPFEPKFEDPWASSDLTEFPGAADGGCTRCELATLKK